MVKGSIGSSEGCVNVGSGPVFVDLLCRPTIMSGVAPVSWTIMGFVSPEIDVSRAIEHRRKQLMLDFQGHSHKPEPETCKE